MGAWPFGRAPASHAGGAGSIPAVSTTFLGCHDVKGGNGVADYCPFVRSNYFRVKDPEAFKSWCERLGLEVIEDGERPGLYGFIADGGIPDSRPDPETGEEEEIDFFAELAGHLAEGQVTEVREIGYEKMRYLIGVTHAVRWDGEVLEVSLDDIYALVAAQWGLDMTRAEY